MSDAGYGGYGDYGAWKGWSGREFGQCGPELARYFLAELRSAGLWPIAGLSLLEVGFGNGEFAQWATSHGAKYLGIERLSELVSAGRAAGYCVHASDCELARTVGVNSLDGVVAFDVFEHLDLSELQRLMSDLWQCLRPGGLLVGRVPSGDSPFARAIQHGDITHRLILGNSALRQIAASCGFQVLRVGEPAFPLRGQSLKSTLKRGLVRIVRASVFPFLRWVFLANEQAVLTPNMLFVMRKPL